MPARNNFKNLPISLAACLVCALCLAAWIMAPPAAAPHAARPAGLFARDLRAGQAELKSMTPRGAAQAYLDREHDWPMARRFYGLALAWGLAAYVFPWLLIRLLGRVFKRRGKI